MVFTDESIEEVNNFLNSTKAYIGTDGKFVSSIGTDNVTLVLHNMTFDN